MVKFMKTLARDATIKESLNEYVVTVGWCHVDERIEVNNGDGLDIYLLLTQTTVQALEEEYGTPDFEGDLIDVPTYFQLNEQY